MESRRGRKRAYCALAAIRDVLSRFFSCHTELLLLALVYRLKSPGHQVRVCLRRLLARSPPTCDLGLISLSCYYYSLLFLLATLLLTAETSPMLRT